MNNAMGLDERLRGDCRERRLEGIRCLTEGRTRGSNATGREGGLKGGDS